MIKEESSLFDYSVIDYISLIIDYKSSLFDYSVYHDKLLKLAHDIDRNESS